ncbi:MAG: hypothetical protein M3Z32_06600 [Acidobacteriota bacterium]|nr:hypothetical protein [Acidobacteriota bacterium]
MRIAKDRVRDPEYETRLALDQRSEDIVAGRSFFLVRQTWVGDLLWDIHRP